MSGSLSELADEEVAAQPGSSPASAKRLGPTGESPSGFAAPGKRSRRRRSDPKSRDGRSSLMNVGRRVDYALRALCYLAAQPVGQVVRRADIQLRQGVPPHFLSKILRRLVAARILESVPGARGGFRLGRPASEISIGHVYECVEGSLCLVDCLDWDDRSCCYATVCTQRDVWRGAQEVLLDYLNGITVAAMADRYGLVSRLEQRKTPRPVSAR